VVASAVKILLTYLSFPLEGGFLALADFYAVKALKGQRKTICITSVSEAVTRGNSIKSKKYRRSCWCNPKIGFLNT
jgi:hypothetical protein